MDYYVDVGLKQFKIKIELIELLQCVKEISKPIVEGIIVNIIWRNGWGGLVFASVLSGILLVNGEPVVISHQGGSGVLDREILYRHFFLFW